MNDNRENQSQTEQSEPERKCPLHEKTIAVVETAETPFNPATVLASARFVEFAEKFQACLHPKVVACALMYLQIHPDGFRFWENMALVNSENVTAIVDAKDLKMITDSIMQSLGIVKPDRFFSNIQIRDYLMEALGENGKAYHGFNGAFEESIRANGLAPGIRLWDEAELKEVCDIFNRRFRPGDIPIGFADRDQHKVFWDGDPQHTYNYAVKSPEWFAFLTEDRDEGMSSYDEAKGKMIRKLDSLALERGLTLQEKITVLEFFEKYWKLLRGANARLMVALIPKRLATRRHEFRMDEVKEKLSLPFGIEEEEVVRIMVGTLLVNHFINCSTDETIPASELTIMELPVLSSSRRPTGGTAEKPAVKESDRTDTYNPSEIAEMVCAEAFEPRHLIEALKKDSELKGLFEADAGVSEGFTIGRHTEMAINEFEKYFSGRRFDPTVYSPVKNAAFYDMFGKPFFRILLAMHDIGKPFGPFDKKKQHEESVKIAEKHARHIGMKDIQVKTICALIDGDALGQYLQGRIGADEAAQVIAAQIKKSGLDPVAFNELLRIYYMCDTHSYSSESGGSGAVDHVFESDPEKGELRFSEWAKFKLDELENKLYEKLAILNP